MWLGMIFFSCILGLGLSWLLVPPYESEAIPMAPNREG